MSEDLRALKEDVYAAAKDYYEVAGDCLEVLLRPGKVDILHLIQTYCSSEREYLDAIDRSLVCLSGEASTPEIIEEKNHLIHQRIVLHRQKIQMIRRIDEKIGEQFADTLKYLNKVRSDGDGGKNPPPTGEIILHSLRIDIFWKSLTLNK